MPRLAAVVCACLLAATACASSASRADRPLVRAAEGTMTSSSATSTSSSPLTTVAPTTSTAAVAPPPVPGVPGGLVTPRGIVVPVLSQTGSRSVVRTPCGAEATVVGGRSVTGATVVLDPGHGGPESGAVGPNGLTEATLNLAVTEQTRRVLQAAGVDVILTRTAEYEVSLATRTELATKLRPKAFVSIHHNSDPDGPRDGPGTETYYQIGSPTSKRLAGLIYEEVVRTLSAYQVSWVADRDAGAKYRQGEHGDYYSVLRRTAGVTSALAELAFISNPPEASMLAQPEVQRVEGDAVARGILRYLTTNDPGSGFVEPYPRPPDRSAGGSSRPCKDPPL